jgi:four helix bundle protein
MINEPRTSHGIASRKYDLEERLGKFADDIIRFLKKIPNIPAYWRLTPQLVASATSIGANYMEATEAESLNDFIHKCSIARKEAKETKFWIKRVINAEDSLRKEVIELGKECHEIHLILSKTVITSRKKLTAQS